MEPLGVTVSDVADTAGKFELSSQTEGFDNGAIPLNILVFDIIEQSPASADQHQKSSSGMVVFGVNLEMFRQIGYAVRNEANLHFR